MDQNPGCVEPILTMGAIDSRDGGVSSDATDVEAFIAEVEMWCHRAFDDQA